MKFSSVNGLMSVTNAFGAAQAIHGRRTKVSGL